MKEIGKTNIALTGFTLVEMAMVLLIIGLLLGGLLPTISTQRELQRINETQKMLGEIREGLIGYALLNGRLPCPTTTSDPSNANYGQADPSCSAAPTTEGYIPWKSLGVPEFDSWGNPRSASTDPWIGHWRYRVDRNFASTTSPITFTTVFSADALTIKNNAGTNVTTTTERPIAIVFSTGKDKAANGQNASFEASSGIYQSDVPTPTFDDIVVWLSRPLLFNRLVTAGKLP